jgi:hypothetical protein
MWEELIATVVAVIVTLAVDLIVIAGVVFLFGGFTP